MTRTLDDLKDDLAALGPAQRASFAAACAQRLWPTYERVAKRTHVAKVRRLMDDLWASLDTPDDDEPVMTDRELERLESKVDDPYRPTDAYETFMVTALSHATERDDDEAAFWAAAQNVDAKGHELRLRLGSVDMPANIYARAEIVAIMDVLYRDLATVTGGEIDAAALRRAATADGEAWADDFLRPLVHAIEHHEAGSPLVRR